DLEAGGDPAERAAPLGADRERGRHGGAALRSDRYRRLVDRDGLGFVRQHRERRELAGASFERRGEKPVLDVVTEGVEPDLACRKAYLPRPQEPPRVVDDRHEPARGRLLCATLPPPEHPL